MGLTTVLGLARRGFFIPYRYAGGLPEPGHNPTYREIESVFAATAPEMRSVIAAMHEMAAALRKIGADHPPEPRWNQHWFPGLDGAAAYVLTRRHEPARIVEVGSGHSTRFFARAVRDGALATEITAIDPAPRASLDGLGIALVRKTVHEAGTHAFEALAVGDFLMIDSSHILMPGSDVDFLFNRVLPALPGGTFVHIHDVFLPDDYPPAWGWRGYNEQQGVAALLQGGAFEPIFASHYVRTRMAGDLAGPPFTHFAPLSGAVETSLWLKKVANSYL
jgi:predicted O-methyltransferase YrrM